MRRGISRLCHFTRSSHLPHIVESGILPRDLLDADRAAVFTPTDDLRLDAHRNCVCCSVEYPNAWYLDRAMANERIYRDWVVIFVSAHYLWDPNTLYCPRNAAANRGAEIKSGLDGFQRMFADDVAGSQGIVRGRSGLHLPCCATDDQAEVLVPGSIPVSDILGIAVATVTQARNELVRLRLSGSTGFRVPLVVAPALFSKNQLRDEIRRGVRPVEEPYAG